MSARDEILEKLWWSIPSANDTEARENAAKLLDAYAAEVRSAALREAADICAAEPDTLAADPDVANRVISYDVCYGADHMADKLRRMAEEGQ